MPSYDPSVPVGQHYGLSGAGPLPGTSTSSFGSGPTAAGLTAGQQSQLQNALSASGIWDGVTQIGADVWNALSKLNIDWSDVGSWIKNNIDTVKSVVGLVGGIKGAFDDSARRAESDKYAQQALKDATDSYRGKEPLRLAGQAGLLNPQSFAPNLTSLGMQGQNATSSRAPQTLPMASGNLQNAQHMANGPTSTNPFTRTLPVAQPQAAVTPPTPTAPQMPPVLPQKPPGTLPLAPAGVAPTPAQLEGPHLAPSFSPTPPGFGTRQPGQMIKPLPIATYN